MHALPKDILLVIADNIDPYSIDSFINTCKRFRNFASEIRTRKRRIFIQTLKRCMQILSVSEFVRVCILHNAWDFKCSELLFDISYPWDRMYVENIIIRYVRDRYTTALGILYFMIQDLLMQRNTRSKDREYNYNLLQIPEITSSSCVYRKWLKKIYHSFSSQNQFDKNGIARFLRLLRLTGCSNNDIAEYTLRNRVLPELAKYEPQPWEKTVSDRQLELLYPFRKPYPKIFYREAFKLELSAGQIYRLIDYELSHFHYFKSKEDVIRNLGPHLINTAYWRKLKANYNL